MTWITASEVARAEGHEQGVAEERARVLAILDALTTAYREKHGGGGDYCRALGEAQAWLEQGWSATDRVCDLPAQPVQITCRMDTDSPWPDKGATICDCTFPVCRLKQQIAPPRRQQMSTTWRA